MDYTKPQYVKPYVERLEKELKTAKKEAHDFKIAYNREHKKVDELEKQNAQMSMRETKFHRQKEKTNEIDSERLRLVKENEQLRQQCGQEVEKSYILFTCWDRGDIDSRFVDNLFAIRCLKKVGGFDEPIYGNTLTYLYTGTPSARKEITRTLTSMLQSLYPDSNISVYAKERLADGQTTEN